MSHWRRPTGAPLINIKDGNFNFEQHHLPIFLWIAIIHFLAINLVTFLSVAEATNFNIIPAFRFSEMVTMKKKV